MIKNLFKKFKKSNAQKVLANDKGQGMLEYILLVVVLVGIIVTAKGFLGPKMEEIQGQLGTTIDNVLGK
jgi:hypothetical protein